MLVWSFLEYFKRDMADEDVEVQGVEEAVDDILDDTNRFYFNDHNFARDIPDDVIDDSFVIDETDLSDNCDSDVNEIAEERPTKKSKYALSPSKVTIQVAILPNDIDGNRVYKVNWNEEDPYLNVKDGKL